MMQQNLNLNRDLIRLKSLNLIDAIQPQEYLNLNL